MRMLGERNRRVQIAPSVRNKIQKGKHAREGLTNEHIERLPANIANPDMVIKQPDGRYFVVVPSRVKGRQGTTPLAVVLEPGRRTHDVITVFGLSAQQLADKAVAGDVVYENSDGVNTEEIRALAPGRHQGQVNRPETSAPGGLTRTPDTMPGSRELVKWEMALDADRSTVMPGTALAQDQRTGAIAPRNPQDLRPPETLDTHASMWGGLAARHKSQSREKTHTATGEHITSLKVAASGPPSNESIPDATVLRKREEGTKDVNRASVRGPQTYRDIRDSLVKINGDSHRLSECPLLEDLRSLPWLGQRPARTKVDYSPCLRASV